MLGAALTAGFLYWLLRQMERWLQQHIFKVGWLLTKDFRTTTVLYYVFFLPGVLLHEVSLWLVAGLLNVRADRAAQFPQPQEIPELRLNFVRVSPRATKWKLAIIELAPALAGITVVAIIATSVLDIAPALGVMRTGQLEDVGAGFRLLTSKADFWLWTYVLLTVANTMSPKFTSRESLVRPIAIALAVAVAVIFALGIAQDAVAAFSTAFTQVVDVLAAVFGVTVIVNAAAIFVLAVIENSIERFTGDSATIDKNGKLVAKKRSEILAERLAERQRAAKAREADKPAAPGATEGIPSIYRLPLPLPDTSEPAKRVIMPPPAAGTLEPPRHRDPDVIEGKADVKLASLFDDENEEDTEVGESDSPGIVDATGATVSPVVRPTIPRPALPASTSTHRETPTIPLRTAAPNPPPKSPDNELDLMGSAFGDSAESGEDYEEEDDDIEPV